MKNKIFSFSQLVTYVCIIVCILLSAVLVTDVWGRFFTQAEGEDGARVASYVVAVNVENGANESVTLDLNGLSPSNPEKIFTLIVTNTKNGKTSEVAQKYTISVEVTGASPLTCALASDDVTVSGNTASGSFSVTPQADTFTLTVNWVEANTVQGADAEICDDISLLTVTVQAEQID